MKLEILPATPETWAVRGCVHAAAWQETYRGLMPDAYMDTITPAFCTGIAHRDYAAGGGEKTLLAYVDGSAAGFARFEPQARGFVGRPGTGEICALYLLRAYQGRGAGRALMEACLQRLPASHPVAVFVLKGNERAVGFYRHMGFAFTGRSIEQQTGFGPITELEMLREPVPL